MAFDGKELLTLSAEIVTSYLSNNAVASDRLPEMIARVHGALVHLGKEDRSADGKPVPAVAVNASVKSGHVVCLEDGRKFKVLKRHLASEHGMTPAQYRAKWELPDSYPMVAPEYTLRRQKLLSGTGGNFGAASRRANGSTRKGR